MKKMKQFRPKRHRPKKEFQATEKSNRGSLYDKQWNRYRFRFLHHNPFCYICAKKATVVDHVVAHKGDESLFKNVTNHIPLCKIHHDVITGKFDRTSTPKTEEKMKWIESQRELHGVNLKVKVVKDYDKGKK